jgi:alkanesulfonate monooxygenase SsuD/methylene tetrahydromethanopterin reductase-like flavin-dependent oxidoreductase (luciferase family)
MARKGLKLGFLLPTRGLIMQDESPDNANEILSLANHAENAGFDSVWVGDSLTAKPRLEPLTTLAAVAGHTNRVRLGTAVLLAALRNPVLLAQTLGTLDLISGGRTVLTVGAGGSFNAAQKAEWNNAGISASSRGRRMEELVEIVKMLGTKAHGSFQGDHFDIDNVTVGPKPLQKGGVPILFACHLRAKREAQFERTGRIGDGYISISESPEGFAEIRRKVSEYANLYGRESDEMEAVYYMTVNLNSHEHSAAKEADSYLMKYYGANIWGNTWGPWGDPKRIADRIGEFADAGADTIIVRFASPNQRSQLDLFIDQVLPEFQPSS